MSPYHFRAANNIYVDHGNQRCGEAQIMLYKYYTNLSFMLTSFNAGLAVMLV